MMRKTELLLFDMDGVLLTPGGYHRALADTVTFMASRLGFSGVRLSQQDIHGFEAAGITNEWDSAAMCTAFMAETLQASAGPLAIDHNILKDSLAANGLPAPEFSDLVRRIDLETSRTALPVDRAKRLFPESLHWILDSAYRIDGLTQRVQQEHVLGSETFAQVYGLAPLLDVASYLVAFDRTNLGTRQRENLLRWTRRDQKGAAIFTNRPSISPDGRLGTPEAEMGARVVGLEDLPLAGTGGGVWLEERFGKQPGTYNKPHPVHAFAALRMAAGEGAAAAFEAAAQLFETGELDPTWRNLNGGQAWVFEDATGGLESLRIAAELLMGRGILLEAHLVGISGSPVKQQALRAAGAVVYPDLDAALSAFYESQAL